MSPLNGQVERMNRTIKEATVKRYHYDNHTQLTAHLRDFINAYNYGCRLKRCAASPPTNMSEKSGQPSLKGSHSTRTIKCRD
jgi:hypothetical protein